MAAALFSNRTKFSGLYWSSQQANEPLGEHEWGSFWIKSNGSDWTNQCLKPSGRCQSILGGKTLKTRFSPTFGTHSKEPKEPIDPICHLFLVMNLK